MIVADLAMAVALGGDCLADIAVLRAQPALAGPVVSDPVVSRLVAALAGDAPRAVKAIRAARCWDPAAWPACCMHVPGLARSPARAVAAPAASSLLPRCAHAGAPA